MSKYKEVKTEFKNAQSLLGALKDLKIPFETLGQNLTINAMWLEGYGAAAGAEVAIRIPKKLTGGFEDVGFSWNGNSYDAHISTHDGEFWLGHRNIGDGTLKQIKQRYALREVRRAAAARGYTVSEQSMPDGTIQVVCNRY